MSPTTARLPKSRTFLVLLVGSALVSVLPPAWFSWIRGVLQPLGLVQYGVAAGTRGARNLVGELGEPEIPQAAARRLVIDNEELRRTVGHQSATIVELEEQVARVTGIRDQLRDGATTIRIAPVIGYVCTPHEEALLIGRGSRHGLSPGQWVVAATGERSKDSGRELIAGQWLVGQVAEVHTLTARVRLASDPRFGPIRVWAAAERPDGTWELDDSECLLIGRGAGRMEIGPPTADHYAVDRRIVVVRPQAGLPATLAIGRIVASARVPAAPLHFRLDVRPVGDVRRLDSVFVIVPED